LPLGDEAFNNSVRDAHEDVRMNNLMIPRMKNPMIPKMKNPMIPKMRRWLFLLCLMMAACVAPGDATECLARGEGNAFILNTLYYEDSY
jgi:hypothetical protein